MGWEGVRDRGSHGRKPTHPSVPLSPLCAASLDQTEPASALGAVLDETSQRGEQGVDVLPGPERDDGGATAGLR